LRIAKENPKEKTCIKCNNTFISNKAHNICSVCESKHNKERWPKYAKTINRSNKETVAKVKLYQDSNRLDNEKWLLEMCGGIYKCSLCGFSSKIKKLYDLHHTNQAIKTDQPAQLIRRANFKEIYYKEKLELLCKPCHKNMHLHS
jgi:RNA polymerase subunit RPABC4/transcription elongation factor Spt4